MPKIKGHPSAVRVPTRLWGMSMQSLTGFNASTTPYHDLGQTVFRLWDTGTTWRLLEPTKGTHDTTRLDALLSIAQQRGLFVLYTLGQAPAFATGGTAGGPYAGSGVYNNSIPVLSDWQDHINWISSTYAGRIGAYELWNECDIPDFWNGTISDLMALVAAASTIIRANDPSALILAPSFTGGNAPKIYIDLYAQAGIGAYVDGFAYHSYVFPLQPEAIIGQAEMARAAMTRNGLGSKQLWQTECSWYTYYDATGAFVDKYQSGGSAMSQAQASGYVARIYLAGVAARFDSHVFYGLDYPFSHIRLIDLTDKTQRLDAGTALRFCAQTLASMSLLSADQTGALWSYRFTGPTGYVDVFFCQDQQTVTRDLSVYRSVKDVLGADVTPSATQVVTWSPLYCFR